MIITDSTIVRNLEAASAGSGVGLDMLMENAGKVVTRDRIIEKIWDVAGNFVNDNTLTVYIKRIRNKLKTDQIHTVKGIGYKMEEV